MNEDKGQPIKVWVKRVGQEDSDAEVLHLQPRSTVSELKDVLYASPKFALVAGTIDHLTVGDEVRIPVVPVLTVEVVSNRDLVDEDPNKTYTVHLKQAPERPSLLRAPSTATVRLEGIATDGTCFITQREETIQKVLYDLQTNNVVFVRSPPYSGKTSLSQLLYHHLKASFNAMWFTFLTYNDANDVESHWTKKTGATMDYWFTEEDSVPRYIIIDELNAFYHIRDSVFWKYLKAAESAACPYIKVICFASYGERSTSLAYGTPISFNIVRGIELLCCSLAEANELLEDFNQRNSKRVVLSEDLKHHLYVLTGGHLGFLSRILSFCLSRIDITDDQSLAMFILSNAFVADICELRGVPRFGQMSDHQNAICREIILSGLYTPPRGIDEEREMMDVEDLPSGSLQTDGLTQLIREGWVCKTGDRVTFSSPVIVYVASIQLFGAYRMNDEISNFVEFLFLCLQRLDPANLRDSLGRGNDDTLLERSWQMEFYRAATTCLGRKSHISPDVGHVFGSSGYIDFYVNGDKQWAIELTREGSEVREHESRFTGIYALIPMKEKAVIDFRVRPVRKYVDLVWYVQYDATNYRTATVSRKGLDGMIHQADITFNGNQAFIPFLPKEW